MPIIKKYEPNYAALYPNTEIHPDVLYALKKSDRKMKYMEYDLKRERTRRDKTGAVIVQTSREDSYDRLLDVDKQFAGSSSSPEDVFFAREEIRELHRGLTTLDADDRELINALFFEGNTELEYSLLIGQSRSNFNRRKRIILRALNKSFDNLEI